MGMVGVAGQGHERAWALAGVELGRHVAMGLAMGEDGRERDLRILPHACRHARGAAGGRAPPVGGDDEASRYVAIRDGADGHSVGPERIALRHVLDEADARVGACGRRHGGDEHAVLDVPAERVEADLA